MADHTIVVNDEQCEARELSTQESYLWGDR